MDWYGTYIVEYFILLAIALVMIVNSILRYKQHKRISICIILTNVTAILLSVSKTLELFCRENGYISWLTFFAFLGYVLNPFCLLFFIIMSGEVRDKKRLLLLFIPWVVNFFVYILMFIPGARDLVAVYKLEGGVVRFHGNWMRFSSHTISFFYLLTVLYISFSKISHKHIGHGLTILACSLFVVAAVVIESAFNESGRVQLLSKTIALSTIVYYMFLYVEKASLDALTGLYNRGTYYHDVEKMNRSITGVIQFDMNGLKYINDHYGHLEGDKAILGVANIINKCVKRNMYVYRIGGDEYLVLVVNGKEEDLKQVVEDFKQRIKDTDYHCSIGCSYRKNKKQGYEELFKEAEQLMYEDKADFYKNAKFDRRKV